jgi:hypothetical protein
MSEKKQTGCGCGCGFPKKQESTPPKQEDKKQGK